MLSAIPICPVSKNSLLAQFPESSYNRLSYRMQWGDLPLGEVLYEVGQKIDRIYFPTAGMASMVLTASGGAGVEVGIVSGAGLIGIDALLSGDTAEQCSVVQVKGSAVTIPVAALLEEMERSHAVQKLIFRYTKILLAQTAQYVLCQASHNIEQRLCRWILTVADQVGCDTLDITQESIACTLGARRSTITVVAGKLRSAGTLDYSYGHIQLLDRALLEAASCGCYRTIRNELQSLKSTPNVG